MISDLSVGGVSVPDKWGQNLEVAFARETPSGFAGLAATNSAYVVRTFIAAMRER